MGALVSGAGVADAAAQPHLSPLAGSSARRGTVGTNCVRRGRSISLMFASSLSEQIDAMANKFIIQ